MNTTIPLPHSTTPPTLAQLFGSNYEEAYLKYLPEQIRFSQPIVPRIDFRITKKRMREFRDNYNLELEIKYPKIQGKNRMKNHPVYNEMNICSGALATLYCMIEMYAGFLSAVREGMEARIAFTLRPSAIASRRSVSTNTINTHVCKMEQAGIIKRGEMRFDQSYETSFNPNLLCALTDKNYREEIVKNIVEKAPKLADDEFFQDWQKRLNPSFFALAEGGSPKILSMYLLIKQEQDINIPDKEFFNMWGKGTFPPHPLSKQEQADTNAGMPADDNTATLGAEKVENPKSMKGLTNSPLKVGGDINFFTDNAFAIAIGILDMFWYDKIKAGVITKQQIYTAKNFIRCWLLQNGAKEKLSFRDYIDKILIPTLKMQRGALLKYDYGWIPYIDKYFDPQWICNDGSPAGYRKAMMKYDELKEKEKKRKLKKGTKEKMKKFKQRGEIFSKEFFFLLRNPSEKNYLKSENRIRALKDDELTKIFFKSVFNTKLLPLKFMREREIKYVQ